MAYLFEDAIERIDAGGKGGDRPLLEQMHRGDDFGERHPPLSQRDSNPTHPDHELLESARAQRLGGGVEVQAAYLEKLALGERTLLWDHELAELAPIMNALARRHQKIMMPPHR